MRLAQLARKLSLKPAEVQAFLAGHSGSIEFNPNSKLTDEQVVQAVRHFNPSMEAEILREPPATESLPEPTVVDPDDSATIDEAITTEPAIDDLMQMQGEESIVPLESEVIRAPKVDLPGLRVVGKIELKEPKKKEEPAVSPENAEEQPRRPVRPVRQEKPRQWRNPLEAQRQREAEERQDKREKEIELEKQRRTQKYLNKVKSVPTKAAKRVQDEAVEVQEDTRPAPKTWLGKFARWLTS